MGWNHAFGAYFLSRKDQRNANMCASHSIRQSYWLKVAAQSEFLPGMKVDHVSKFFTIET